MKRNVTVFLSFLMVLLVITIGCTGKKTSTSTETITVGIASQSLKEQVYRDMQVGVEEKAKELGAVVEWQICDYDPQRELEIVNNYITKGVDVLIIEAVNTETSTPMMEAAFDANIPVVALETELLGGSGPVVRITCNFRRIGQAQVEKFIEDWGEGKPANVVILAGTNTDFVAQEIVYGNHDILDNHPYIKIIQEEWHNNWDRQLAMNTVQNVLARGDRIDAVFSNNDAMGIGAVRAAEEAGLKNNILFYSMDHDEDAVQEMMTGTRYTVVDKSSRLQGQRLMEAAYAAAKGQEIVYDEIVHGIKTWYTPFRYSSYNDLSVSKEVYPHLF